MSKLQSKKVSLEKPVILFIAFGVNNPRKGFHFKKIVKIYKA